jgi:predicted PurR-regulated permease PerM
MNASSLASWINQLPSWLGIALAIPLVVLDGWVLLITLNYLQSILSALVIAAILAFLLNYPVQLLQRWGVQRPYAVGLILLTAIAALATLTVTLVPLILTQVEEFIQQLPTLLNTLSQQLGTFQQWATAHRLPINATRLIRRLSDSAPDELETVSVQLPSLVLNAADSLINGLVVVALTLYLLLQGQAFWQGIFRWLPQPLSQTIRPLLQQNFRNYFVGQATIALIEGIVLSLIFFALKLPLFLLCGMGIGLLVLIPFFDLLGVLAVSLLTGLSHVWLGLSVLAICLVVDQVIDNGISPRILGKLVGLNPVWIILSLLIGAKVAGVVGIFLAVPLASTIQDVCDTLYPAPAKVDEANEDDESAATPIRPTLPDPSLDVAG